MQPFFSWCSIGYPANDLVSSWLSQWRQKLNSKFCSTSPTQPQASVLAHLAAQGTRTWVSPHARSITTNRFGRICWNDPADILLAFLTFGTGLPRVRAPQVVLVGLHLPTVDLSTRF